MIIINRRWDYTLADEKLVQLNFLTPILQAAVLNPQLLDVLTNKN